MDSFRTLGVRAVVMVLLLAPGGCLTMEATVRDRASVDFSCDTYQISIQQTAPNQFLATGCGSSRTYLCTPPADTSALSSPNCATPPADAGR